MSVLGILYWLSRIIAIGAIIHVVLDNRQPAKTMAWALVIYFLPLIGVIAFVDFLTADAASAFDQLHDSRLSQITYTLVVNFNFFEEGTSCSEQGLSEERKS